MRLPYAVCVCLKKRSPGRKYFEIKIFLSLDLWQCNQYPMAMRQEPIILLNIEKDKAYVAEVHGYFRAAEKLAQGKKAG